MKYKSITIEEKKDLAPLVGMRIAGTAEYFTIVESQTQLLEALEWAQEQQKEIFMLGGGSNIVVGEAGISGLVISMDILGKDILFEDDSSIELLIAAGENWDAVVAWAVENHWWGIENLSHIPGKMGAFVVQNVGAYGQEAAQVVQFVNVYDLQDQELKTLSHEDCKFAYRRSIFNSSEKGRYIILGISIRLSKEPHRQTSYPDVVKYFEQHEILEPSLQQIRDAIIYIRNEKLPLPEETGNNGSFFKNLLLSDSEFNDLKSQCSQSFPETMIEQLDYFYNNYTRDGYTKIPTAFLIEQCGLKGYSVGGIQVSDRHALVLLNSGKNATFDDLQQLIQHIQDVVFTRCGVRLEIEPEVIGFTL